MLLSSYFYVQMNCTLVCQDNVSRLRVFNSFFLGIGKPAVLGNVRNCLPSHGLRTASW